MLFPFGWFREKKPVEMAKLSASPQTYKLNYVKPDLSNINPVSTANAAEGVIGFDTASVVCMMGMNYVAEGLISTDANNALAQGKDGLLYVKGGTLSQGKDGKLFATVAPPKPAGKTITLNQWAYNGAYYTIGVNGVSVANVAGGSLNLYEGGFINDGHSYSIAGKPLSISTSGGTSTDAIFIMTGGVDFNGNTLYAVWYPDTSNLCLSQNCTFAQIFQNPAQPVGTVNLIQT